MKDRRQRTAVGTMFLLVASCSPRPPESAPTDALVAWLMSSATAAAIREAAVNQRWLAEAPGRVDELRSVMAAVGVADVGGLDDLLAPHRAEFDDLLWGLRQRRPGATHGDLAHWTAVGVLSFGDILPDPGRLPADSRWDAEYLDDIAEVRAIARRDGFGALREAQSEPVEPPPPGLLLDVAAKSPYLAALADNPGLAVFDVPGPPASPGLSPPPGSPTMVGAVPLAADQLVTTDEGRLLILRPGQARARLDYVRTVAYFTLDDGGGMTFDRTDNWVLRRDQLVTVLAEDERGYWAWAGEGRVARLHSECCVLLDKPDTIVWRRLADGPFAGRWLILNPTALVEIDWEEFRRRRGAEVRSPDVRPPVFPRLGALGSSLRGTPAIAGAELIYWREGDPDGEPLVVLHGGPGLGSAYLREPITAALGAERQLFFYDQRASGYSQGAEVPGILTIRRFVEDLELLRDRAGLERLDLLGHSFGGLLALHYALEYPERVRRLILVDSDPASRAEWVQFEARVAERRRPNDAWELEQFSKRQPSADLMTAIFGLQMRAYTSNPEMADRIDFAFTDPVVANWELTGPAIRADLGDWDLHDRLVQITVPTLILAGGDSIFPVDAAERMRDGILGAELAVLPDVGHFPFVEDPRGFAAAVLGFLRRTDSAPER